MGDIMMANVTEICTRPFLDIAKLLSDYPISVAMFVSLIAGLIAQDFIFGFQFFGGTLVALAALYVVTFGKAFGKGGHKSSKLNIRS